MYNFLFVPENHGFVVDGESCLEKMLGIVRICRS